MDFILFGKLNIFMKIFDFNENKIVKSEDLIVWLYYRKYLVYMCKDYE